MMQELKSAVLASEHQQAEVNMRKFILIVPLLFVSAGAYADRSPNLTFAASETIEQIKPAQQPAVATEPPARTKTSEPTKKAEPTRTRRVAKPATNTGSVRRPMSTSRRTYESDEDKARRIGAQYGVTW